MKLFGSFLGIRDVLGNPFRILGNSNFGIKLGNKGLNKRETALFCSQLRLLLAAGMPLLQGLKIMEGLISKKYRAGIDRLIIAIGEGQPFNQAAKGLLPDLALGSVRAAERSGKMEETLNKLAEYYESKAELEEKFISALAYPSVVLLVSLLSVLALVIFVLPGIKEVFADLGSDLPPLTKFILSLSDSLPRYGVLILSAIVLIIVASKRKIKANNVEAWLLHIPLVNKMLKQDMVIRGFGSLGVLLINGIPMLEALDITAASVFSPGFRKLIIRGKEQVENGGSLSASFASSSLLPPEVNRMLTVGENTGRLGEMLANIADFQAKERELLLKRLTSLIEPAMTLAVGGVVALVAFAIFIPLVNMIATIK